MIYKIVGLFFICFFYFPHFLFAQTGIDHWETVIFAEDVWSYRVGDSEPPSDWMQPSFDDTDWLTGVGGFGYGDDDDNTTIPTTISLYLRINFEIADTSKISMAVLHADYDDAFVAYLNGSEFARGNFGIAGMPPAYNEIPPIDHEAALYLGGVPEAYPLYPQTFDNLIKEGQNTLAIQIHNFQLSSSDFSSAFFLSLGINDNSNDFEPVPDWFYEPFIASNLPLLLIHTHGQNIVDEPKIIADLDIIDNGSGNLNYITDPSNGYDGKIAIEIRGASSQSFPKNNYGFETRNEFGENNNVPLLGMPEENDWVLHGPFSDKSLIRNALTFDIARKMMKYASRTRFCEVLINEDYRGVYLLMERIKRDTFRVAIANLKPEDIEGDELTGGYIFQMDRDNPDTEEDGWYSPYGSNPFYAYHSPGYENLLPVQKEYLLNWMNGFESAMTQSNYASIYKNYLDMNSFVDYFLINELTKHVDAFKLSFYMYKRKDSNGGKLHMGPVWDFNLGYSNFTFECPPDPEGWIYPCTSRAFWLNKILTIPEVQNRLACRWEELRGDILNTDNLIATIDQMIAELEEATVRNFTRWNILGTEVWPNYFIGATHEEEINFLKNWLLNRIVWMDQNMLGAAIDCNVGTNDFFNNERLEVYPNPFSEQVIFSYTSDNFEKGEVQIFDVLGKKVGQFLLENNKPLSWNAEGLASGIYFYEITVEGVTVAGRIVKK